MSEKDLPDNIVPIRCLRIEHDKKKKCTCRNRSFTVDYGNKEVLCAECGAIVQPFDVVWELARHNERLNDETEYLLEQRKKILNWKPHLLPLRAVEQIYRGGKMLPSCPHCRRGILVDELKVMSVNKEMELERRKFEDKQKD